MKRNQIAWWILALAIVLLSLSRFFERESVASITIAWCGFGIGILGCVIWLALRSPPDEPLSKPPKKRNQIAWWILALGFLLLVSNRFFEHESMVSITLAWSGFGIGILSAIWLALRS
jgi:hypothetical protein